MSTMNKDKFQSALAALDTMVKSNATQLFHTASDSDPGQHAGVSTTDYQDEHKDGISENGTDYDGVKKQLADKVEKSQALTPAEVAIAKGQDPRPLIADKVAKGQTLTAAEAWVTKGGWAQMSKSAAKPSTAGTPGEAKDAGSVPDTNAGTDETDSEIEADAKKSLAGAIAKTTNLRQGIEMSAILAEFARAMGTALEGTEARVAQRVTKSVAAVLSPVLDRVAALESSLAKSFGEQREYNNAYAEALVGIGQHVAGASQAAAAQASQPVAGPRSQFRPQQGQYVEKAFGNANSGSTLSKSQVVDIMTDLAKSNKIAPLHVIKFETTGELSPDVQSLILAHAGQGR